jgi:adenosylcobyric acid synthase
MAKSLMIQGTGSGVGKSLFVSGLCRIFSDMGIKVTPFKAQNMALNSFITREGGEIGRAQALQAEASRVEPSVDMNPILLKASGEMGSQVIIHGKVHSTMKAKEYYAFKRTAWEAVKTSFGRLSKQYDLIIMEGAGSPAEINLMDADIVNIAAARHAKAPVVLVGDIDKGGVFASLYGTIKLLGKNSRQIKAFVINKFRGDMDILNPGLEMIKARTGRPVIGVLPYINDIGLPEEDGLAIERVKRFKQFEQFKKVKIVVVRLRYISNFTDFDPFYLEPDVELIYSENPAEIENGDLVIVPGSKNTVKDLMLLKEKGLDKSIQRAYQKGIQVIGLCGGYQMLGKNIFDPHGVESHHKKIKGIGLLDIETTFDMEKTTCRVEAELINFGMQIAECEIYTPLHPSQEGNSKIRNPKSKICLKGYEIHMGVSTGDIGLFRIKRLAVPHSPIHPFTHSPLFDGSKNNNCWGTYIHGIFENDLFRRGVLNEIRKAKGLKAITLKISYADVKDKAIDNLAGIIEKNVDVGFIRRMIRL